MTIKEKKPTMINIARNIGDKIDYIKNKIII